jgi:hypothetical protein
MHVIHSMEFADYTWNITFRAMIINPDTNASSGVCMLLVKWERGNTVNHPTATHSVMKITKVQSLGALETRAYNAPYTRVQVGTVN